MDPAIIAEIIWIMSPIIVTIIVITQAQPLPFSRPYDTIKYAIPRISITTPRTNGIIPRDASCAISVEMPLLWIMSSEDIDKSAPSPMRDIPPMRRDIPPIIIKIAMIVTPIGLSVFVVKSFTKLWI